MQFSDLETQPHHLTRLSNGLPMVARLRGRPWRWLPFSGFGTLLVFLAYLGATWFAYQVMLVPQPAHFNPHWARARWIQAANGKQPVAYFRYTTTLDAIPESGFVTIAASQVFWLYINGRSFGSNALDLVQGDYPRAYIYDISSGLTVGPNVIAVRVANLNQQTPELLLSLGLAEGHRSYHYGTNQGWQATMESSQAHPRYAASLTSWTVAAFDASAWRSARVNSVDAPGPAPFLTIDPQLYEQPLPLAWMSAGSGPDAYFVRQIALPAETAHVWLRLAATGTADLYINGHLLIIWTGQPAVAQQNLAIYLSDAETPILYRSGLAMGVYDVSPFLHPGLNSLAVHVVSPGNTAARLRLENVNTALALDVLTSNSDGQDSWQAQALHTWHASQLPGPDWASGGNQSLAWLPPIQIGRPGAVRAFYLPEDPTSRNVQSLPLDLLARVGMLSLLAVVGSWLLVSLLLTRYSSYTLRMASDLMSLAFLPALALEGLLLVLAREPLLPSPFSRTWLIGLGMLVSVSYAGLWLHQHFRSRTTQACLLPLLPIVHPTRATQLANQWSGRLYIWRQLRKHWLLLVLVLIALPLSLYNLSYEPYWQDELASYYAAHGILSHGLPFFPSGFLYPKAELYSYFLALWTSLFGVGQGMSRAISACEYLLSLPLLYVIGCYFFKHHVAILATAMLTLSPICLVWARQMRMYEQAQLLTLLVIFLFYKALQERHKVYFIYLATGSLLLTYLSHEETFIFFPGLLLCVLLASRERQYKLPAVLYRKHWWFALLICTIVIGLQLWITRVSHPPLLGTDSTQRPLVMLTSDNLVYYFYLLFLPGALGHGTLPWITLNSLLAAAGCWLARRFGTPRVQYCALFLVGSLLTLIFLFTFQADRYIYPFLPIYYLLSAYALLRLIDAGRTFAITQLTVYSAGDLAWQLQPRLVKSYQNRGLRLLLGIIAALIFITVLIAPVLPLGGYNEFVSSVVGLPDHRHYADYDAVGQYLRQHWRPGDTVIAVAPANCVLYYAGHVDYFFSVDRALYLLESHSQLIETASGAHALLNQDDFQAVLASSSRVWVVSDGGSYESAVLKRFTFPLDLQIVFEGYGSRLYVRGDP